MKNLILKLLIIFFLQNLLFLERGLTQFSRLSLQIQLRKLDEKLRYAEEIVTAYGGKAALDYLRQAKEMRTTALNLFHSPMPLRAAAFIKKAFFFLDLAIRTTLAKSGHRMAEQLEELIKQAEQAVVGCNNKEAERLLFQAKKNQERGLHILGQTRIEKGLEHIRLAYFLAEKVLKLCKKRKLDIEDNVLDEKEQFERLLERAQEAVEKTNNPQARDRIEKALNQAEQADKALLKRDFKRALEHYHNATRLLWRGIELAKSTETSSENLIAEKIQKELDLLDAAIEELSGRVSTAEDNQRAQFLYQRSLKLREEAQLAFSAGRLLIAQKKINMAQNAIGRALGFLRQTDFSDSNLESRAETELQLLKDEIDQQKQDDEIKNSSEAMRLLELAEHNLQLAEQTFKAKNYHLGFERIFVARQLVFWTEKTITSAVTASINLELVQSNLNSFDEQFEQQAQTIEASAVQIAITLLRQAQNFREKAEQALKNNQLNLAQAFIETSLQLLQRSKRLSQL